MKKIWFALIISLLIIPIVINQANALIQYGGAVELQISPGETKTFEWQLRASQGEGELNLEMGSYGWGSQFFSYPENLDVPVGEIGTVEVSVTIPFDHPGGVVLGEEHGLRTTATEFGESGGTTTINIRASKIIILTILQNEDEQYWSNTAYDEPIIDEPEVIAETVEEQTPEEETTPFSITAPTESQEEGGGCLISTATFGSELAPQVQMLREIRDNALLTTTSGTSFMSGFNTLYYSFSPAIAGATKYIPALSRIKLMP